MNYISCTFVCHPFRPLNEILVARLATLEFESFEENEPELIAYITINHFDESAVNQICEELNEIGVITFSKERIEDQNWNAEWEKSYPVVTIGDKCIIRAPFHEVEPGNYALDIVINPQMSFGTGHHETTWLVMSLLLKMDLKDKTILDMGSGTGVLAIASAKRGAGRVVAIDNEDWAYRNTLENCAQNDVHITVQKAETIPQEAPQFDLILANINKNVLMELMPSFSLKIETGGTLILSGFFDTDKEDISEAAQVNGFNPTENKSSNNWTVLKCIKR